MANLKEQLDAVEQFSSIETTSTTTPFTIQTTKSKATGTFNTELAPHLTSSYYDNLNEASSSTVAPPVPLYDNLAQIQVIDVEKPVVEQPVVYKMEDLVTSNSEYEIVTVSKSELDELIEKINDMQTLSRDDYPLTSTADMTNISSSSSINSLNKIDEYAKSVSEKYAATSASATQPIDNEEIKPDASEILNEIIQQVLTAQEQVQKLEENEKKEDEFTWENLMQPINSAAEKEVVDDFSWETLMQGVGGNEGGVVIQPSSNSDSLKLVDENKIEEQTAIKGKNKKTYQVPVSILKIKYTHTHIFTFIPFFWYYICIYD